MTQFTVFELLGGEIGMFALVRRFYRRAYSDPVLSHRYDSQCFPRLQRKLQGALTTVLKESTTPTKPYEWEFTEDEWQACLGHFLASIRDTILPPADIERARVLLEDRRVQSQSVVVQSRKQSGRSDTSSTTEE